jgi:hypothetical protein
MPRIPSRANGQPGRKRPGSCGAVTGMAIPQTHAEWEPLTADVATQEDLLESTTPIFAMPLGGLGWDTPRARAALLLLSS